MLIYVVNDFNKKLILIDFVLSLIFILISRDLLDEARDFHLMPERRSLIQSFRTKPRRCNDVVGIIYAVGGQTKSGNSLSTVEVRRCEFQAL